MYNNKLKYSYVQQQAFLMIFISLFLDIIVLFINRLP